MSKRFMFLSVMLLSAVLLYAPYVSYAQTLMTGQFQDFCSSASASEIVSRLEYMSDKAIDITDIEGKKALDYALKNAKVTDNAEILRMLGHKIETESVSLDTPTEIESDNVNLPEDISAKSEDEEPVVNDVKVNVESKKTPATDPTAMSEDSEPDPKPVHKSRIMPDEFMRMCAGASFEMIMNAEHDPQIRAHDMTMPIDHANKNPKLINTKEFLRLEEESR